MHVLILQKVYLRVVLDVLGPVFMLVETSFHLLQ